MDERLRAYVSAGIIASSSVIVGVSLDALHSRAVFGGGAVSARHDVRARDAIRRDTQTIDLFGARAIPSSGEAPERRAYVRLNPNASVNRAWLLAEGPFHVVGDGRRIFTLTFDDGPVPETTPNVLEALKDCGVHASFFVLGQNIDKSTDRAELSRGILRQTAEDGHLIGNHTESHLYLPPLPHEQVIDEIERGRSAIEQTLGRTPELFRPPFGKLDEFGIAYARERQVELVLWNVEDGGDGLSEAVFDRIRQRLEITGGGIVLLHDSRATTVGVVRRLCAWTRAHAFRPEDPSRVGYEIVDLPTFFSETARSPQPFADRGELELARAERHGRAAIEPQLAEKAETAPPSPIRKVRHSPSRRR